MLGTVIELGGFNAAVRVVRDDEEEIVLEVVGDDIARLIGNAGETLLSIQFLVNRMVARKVEGEQVIVLDAAGYRGRRRDALEALACKLADRVKDEQKAVVLSPMSPHDRRVFHQALTDLDGVRTQSPGDGLYRNLVILPATYESREARD